MGLLVRFCPDVHGRSYRKTSPTVAAEELGSTREPNVFPVDDVAFIKAEHGPGHRP